MDKNRKKIIVFFGPPGSGKGTQADMLGEMLHVPVISPGELLRHERDAGTELGKQVEEKITHGILVSDEIVENMLDKRLEKDDVKNGFVLDGYPRRKEQIEFFSKRVEPIIGDNGFVLAIYINVSDDEVKHRIGGRRVCDCGTSYHIVNNPPKQEGLCDLCGSALYQREDDKPEILHDRLRDFHVGIKPLLDFFEKDHELVRVDGHKHIDEIKNDIWEIITARL